MAGGGAEGLSSAGEGDPPLAEGCGTQTKGDDKQNHDGRPKRCQFGEVAMACERKGKDDDI